LSLNEKDEQAARLCREPMVSALRITWSVWLSLAGRESKPIERALESTQAQRINLNADQIRY